MTDYYQVIASGIAGSRGQRCCSWIDTRVERDNDLTMWSNG